MKKFVIAALIVVALVVGLVPPVRSAVFGWFDKDQVVHNVTSVPANKPRDIGVGTRVYGDAVPVDMKAAPKQGDYPVDKTKVTELTDRMEITPEGKLPGKVTLVFKLKHKVDPKKGALILVTRQAGRDWERLQPKLSADGLTASVEADHLSEWWMFFVDPTKYLGNALKDYLADLFLKPFAGAKAPPCPKDKAARATTDDYSVKRTGDAILSCFARDNDKSKRTMTITGNRPYPMEAKHSGFDVVDAGRWKLEFSNLARAFSGSDSILYPHGTITYSVELEMNHFAKISAEYSGATANYVRMDIALQTLAYIVGKLNIKFVTSLDDSMAVIDKLLDYAECYNAYGASIGTLVFKCFTTTALTAVFGSSVGIVMGGLAAVTGFVTWLSSEVSWLSDKIQDRDNATVTVARVNAFNAFVGTWRDQYGSFTINQNKTGYHTAEFRPCYVDGAAWCRIRDLFQFGMKGATSITVDYLNRSTVQFSPNGEQRTLPSHYMTDGPARLTELRLVSPNMVRLTEQVYGQGPELVYSYFCKPGASAAEKRRCGI